MNLFKSFLIVLSLLVSASSWAGPRVVHADIIRSSDETHSFTIPSVSGTPMISVGIVREVPSGSVDSSNVTFTLSFTPAVTSTVTFYVDGLAQRASTDYTISGAVITATVAPATGQSVYVVYSKY